MPVVLLAAVALGDLWLVARYATSFPIVDDWSALKPDALPAGLTWSWLFSSHNGHQVVFTKLQTWLFYRFTGWDLRLQVLCNQVLWTAVAFAAGRVIRRATAMPWPVLAAFLLLLFSFDRVFIDYVWLSTCHFALLFSFASTAWLFDEEQRDRSLLLGVAAAWCAAFSYAAGVTYALASVPVYAAFKLHRAVGARRKTELSRLLIVSAGLIGTAVSAWLSVRHDTLSATAAAPDPGVFLELLAGLVSRGFGWHAYPPAAVGLACAFLVWAPLVSLARRHDPLPAGWWPLTSACAGLCATLISMIYMRGGIPPQTIVMASIGTHYSFFSYLMVPFAAANWYLWSRGPGLRRTAPLAALWLFCIAGQAYSRYWAPARFPFMSSVLESRAFLMTELLRLGPRGAEALTHEIAAALEQAMRLDVRFARRLRDARAAPPRALSAAYDRLEDESFHRALGPFDLLAGSAPPPAWAPTSVAHQDVLVFYPGDHKSLPPELFLFPAGAAMPRPRPGVPALILSPSRIYLLPFPQFCPQSVCRLLQKSAEAPRRLDLQARATQAPLLRGRGLSVGLFEAHRPTPWSVGRGRALLSLRGQARVRVDGAQSHNRPGEALYLPTQAASILIEPLDAAGYRALWVEHSPDP